MHSDVRLHMHLISLIIKHKIRTILSITRGLVYYWSQSILVWFNTINYKLHEEKSCHEKNVNYLYHRQYGIVWIANHTTRLKREKLFHGKDNTKRTYFLPMGNVRAELMNERVKNESSLRQRWGPSFWILSYKQACIAYSKIYCVLLTCSQPLSHTSLANDIFTVHFVMLELQVIKVEVFFLVHWENNVWAHKHMSLEQRRIRGAVDMSTDRNRKCCFLGRHHKNPPELTVI